MANTTTTEAKPKIARVHDFQTVPAKPRDAKRCTACGAEPHELEGKRPCPIISAPTVPAHAFKVPRSMYWPNEPTGPAQCTLCKATDGTDKAGKPCLIATFRDACATVPGVLFQPIYEFRVDGKVRDYEPAAHVPNEASTAFIDAMNRAGVYVMDRCADSAHITDPSRAAGYRFVGLDPRGAVLYVAKEWLADFPKGA